MNFADQGHLGDETDLPIGMDYYWTFMTGKFQQLHEFHLVMLESVFRWILSGLNADGTENHVINTNITHVLRVFATDRYNYENDAYKFYHLRPE